MLDAVSRQMNLSLDSWWGVWLAEADGQGLAINIHHGDGQIQSAWKHPLYNLAHYGPDGAEDGWVATMEAKDEEWEAAAE